MKPEGSTDTDDDGLPEDGEDDDKPHIEVDKEAIHEALKRARELHTVRVKSKLP